MIHTCLGATCRMAAGMFTHIRNEKALSCDVHGGLYSAMEKAGVSHDKKKDYLFFADLNGRSLEKRWRWGVH